MEREKIDLDYFFNYARRGKNHGIVIKVDRDLHQEFYDRLYNELADDLNFAKIDMESQGSKDDKAYKSQ